MLLELILVECSVKAVMGEMIGIPVFDPRIKENNVVENHLIVRPDDEIHTFIGANLHWVFWL